MRIETRDFGEIIIDKENILKFKQPIYGFEHLTEFVVLGDEEMGPNVAWLQSIEDSAICFILINPIIINKDYSKKVEKETSEKLNQLGMNKIECWVIAVIPEEFKNTVVNLKSPILIDREAKSAVQVILESSYPISVPLVHSEKGDS